MRVSQMSTCHCEDLLQSGKLDQAVSNLGPMAGNASIMSLRRPWPPVRRPWPPVRRPWPPVRPVAAAKAPVDVPSASVAVAAAEDPAALENDGKVVVENAAVGLDDKDEKVIVPLSKDMLMSCLETLGEPEQDPGSR